MQKTNIAEASRSSTGRHAVHHPSQKVRAGLYQRPDVNFQNSSGTYADQGN
jgi:hypothetical protein